MIIAQRKLKIVAGPHAGTPVVVSVHLPQQLEGHWSCAYEIGWPKRPRRSVSGGIDAVQALISAMQKIGIELYTSTFHATNALVFDGPGMGYGFPVPKPMRDVLVGDDKLFDGP